MELIEAIRNRRSVRNYAPTPIDRATIEQLLALAVQAPSASNSQPWAFGVIQDAQTLRGYSDRAKEVCLARMEKNPSFQRYRTILSNPSFNIFYDAPAVVCVYAKPGNEPFARTDCAMAIQTFMLAARAQGLGTCWIGFAHWLFDSPELKQELGIPVTYTAVSQLTLGYPEGAFPSPTSRKPLELLFWR